MHGRPVIDPDAIRIGLRRAYDPPSPKDGTRVLVERLWPRGVRKADAAIDLWLKDIAPSTRLREWYGHDPERWDAFRDRYRAELDANRPAVDRLLGLARKGRLTLVFATKDVDLSSAVVLRRYLEDALAVDGA